MTIRQIVLSVEVLGNLSDDEDVKVILREVWTELKIMERESLRSITNNLLGTGKRE